ncbi:MAG: hypothetical protein VXY47_07525 [Bacteroidota bacterium]|nr:hypothetical protein [Bacteroidota bacterium]MEC8968189.1 hypothetical protein [Bacteroidota bacterium]
MKIITNKLFITLLFVGLSITQAFYSQENPKKVDKEAAKIAFFSNKLALTAEESKLFWPVVNEMEKELKDLRIKMKEQIKRSKSETELSDKELESMMDARMELGKKQMDIKIKYHEKFKETLPIKKVAKYYQATKEYKKLQAQRRARMKQKRMQQK